MRSAGSGRTSAAMAALIPELPDLFETYFSAGAVQLRAEVDAVRGDGTPFVLALQLAPLDDPTGSGIAMVIVDVTEQRRLEAAHAAEIEKARRVQETFSRYLAPHVVASLMNDPDSITLGGERRRATMFFADVRGFTRLATRSLCGSRRRDPQRLFRRSGAHRVRSRRACSTSFTATA